MVKKSRLHQTSGTTDSDAGSLLSRRTLSLARRCARVRSSRRRRCSRRRMHVDGHHCDDRAFIEHAYRGLHSAQAARYRRLSASQSALILSARPAAHHHQPPPAITIAITNANKQHQQHTGVHTTHVQHSAATPRPSTPRSAHTAAPNQPAHVRRRPSVMPDYKQAGA